MIKKLKQRILKTHLFNLFTAHLHYAKRRKELKTLVGDLAEKYQKEPMEQIPPDGKYSQYVWVCWWQGEEEMSPIVRKCYENIKRLNFDKNVILITERNLSNYVDFPTYVMEKYRKGIITKTHLSDLLRTELLCRYGGVWMDITLMTWTKIPDEFYSIPVYTGRFPKNKEDHNISQNRWTSFFLVSRYSNNILYRYMTDFWRIYWQKKDELIEYFLVDYALDFGYRNIPAIKKELDNVPVNGCGKNVWELLRILPDRFDKAEIERIQKENWMQKLSYKGESHIQEKSSVPQESVYKKLFLS